MQVAGTGLLQEQAIAISTDGRGAWRDNVFVERLSRSVKYGEVYLRAYDSVSAARAALGRYLEACGGWVAPAGGEGTEQVWHRRLPALSAPAASSPARTAATLRDPPLMR